jgi:hypothetical protein
MPVHSTSLMFAQEIKNTVESENKRTKILFIF